MCEGAELDSDLEFVEPQSFSFCQKRSVVWVESQKDMSHEGTPVKAPPIQKEDYAVHATPEFAFVSRSCAVLEQYLNESDCIKLEIEELELLLGPEDSEVNLR